MNYKNYLEYLKSIREDSLIHGKNRGSEENLKIKLIIPLFQSLGWDVIEDMQFENIGTDIVLFHKQTPQIIIETKSWDSSINSNHLRQCLEYCYKLKSPWVVISTGQITALYCAWTFREDEFLTEIYNFNLNDLRGATGKEIIDKVYYFLGKENVLQKSNSLYNYILNLVSSQL